MVFNPRGVGIPQKTTNIYDPSKNVNDLHYILKILFARYPGSNFYLAGSSFGACVGVRYLATFDHGGRVRGMVSMANPFDLHKAAENVNRPENNLFGKYMVKNLMKKAKFNREALERWQAEKGVDLGLERLERLENTFDFDEQFTFRIHPEHSDHRNYYDSISCTQFIGQIKLPVLFLHARDDPICP